MSPELDALPIALRAYATPGSGTRPRRSSGAASPVGASEWSLTYDTETTIDAAQQLRFGIYQVRHGDDLREAGIFYDPLSLTPDELVTLQGYARQYRLVVRTGAEFVDSVFFPVVYDRDGVCIGLNLPFDLARIAIHHAPARGKDMRGGFTFKLSADPSRPRVQVKHLNGRAALVQFTKPRGQDTPRGMRRRLLRVPARRSHFVDVGTLAGALLSGSWSLATLAHHLKTAHRKLATDEHGGPLTEAYLDYAAGDVHATWECFVALRQQYDRYGLSQTRITGIYSEASLGKAALREMGVRRWRELQPDVPPELLGIILSTYYGGRSEVRLRRIVTRVLYCDFLSMYPTVCVLMGLWRFVIAERAVWEEATDEVQAVLERVTLADLEDPATWPLLTALVQVVPSDDPFPVRADYDHDGQYTIGLNLLTSDRPQWFTLADCVAAKLLSGKPPQVVRALRFRPEGAQAGLRPIDIAGNPAYRVDPLQDDFYRRLIDLRIAVKAELEQAKAVGNTDRAVALEVVQGALKIMANATSYGIFVELNVTEHEKLQEVACYGTEGEPFSTWVHNTEEPGRYFHPVLATLITGAARLMLAIAEQLTREVGIEWAFCDTDSMALARPEGVEEGDFLLRAQQVRDWFLPLNPYAARGPLFKIEEANCRIRDGKPTKALEALYCLAVSAKRYALFNVDANGKPVLRKASAHGLGHLRAPYSKDQAPRSIPAPVVPPDKLGVERWQHDVWYRIVEAALVGHPDQVPLDRLSGFDQPAVSRYAATTPKLLRWFDPYNRGKPYREQVRPFGFMLAFQADRQAILTERELRRNVGEVVPPATELPRPVAPFNADPIAAARTCFDRVTGETVDARHLKANGQVLARYHLNPEAKFHGGDYLDAGPTERRRVSVTTVDHIGKEANRWEEQLYLGEDPEAQIVYGTSPEDQRRVRGSVLRAGRRFGQRALAVASGVSAREVGSILRGERPPRRATWAKLVRAVPQLEAEERERINHERYVLDAVRERCREGSIRRVAIIADVHYPHLTEVLKGRRRPSETMLAKLEAALG